MAAPRVFVSSTCYDLSEIRDNLKAFIENLGYEAVLSDNGDVFYHPDLHTHDSCLQEIQSCDLFILIIGGRYGGSYIADTSKSIVNAEFAVAKQCGIPIFSFVKQDIYMSQHIYKANKGKDLKFPAIQNQEHAIKIFSFIDEVHKSSFNNGIFTFDLAREIIETLRRQWAYMFKELLTNRQRNNQLVVTNHLLENLTLANKKTEELLEKIYTQNGGSKEDISLIDKEIEVSKFYSKLENVFNARLLNEKNLTKIKGLNLPDNWWEYVLSLNDDIEYTYSPFYPEDDSDGILYTRTSKGVLITPDCIYEQLYEVMKTLNKEQREKAINLAFSTNPFENEDNKIQKENNIVDLRVNEKVQ
ncbi:TPA: DUF4062 domain-containing protein [Bacillus cereus]|uniref:DUF4062 domain-containing protein n=1 Tax=Bacillus thuringiensis TaxID=1428 RepID=UPI000BFC52C1|nr:DUF4062 domain-containing protein [Bacillus thuringiensis]PGP44878.1 hypothetical protein COA06_18480 [Bacillus thuringiensis]PGR48644.1 hypothetical protein COC57_10340 [Bacillus thuringiensis]HDR4461393.1 DUF4062 domain-containing protein [Bacillus cereus]